MIRSRHIALYAMCAVATGQSQGSRTVSGGVVSSGDHIPLKRARIELRISQGAVATVLTDGRGQFAFQGVPAGRCTLAASARAQVDVIGYGENRVLPAIAAQERVNWHYLYPPWRTRQGANRLVYLGGLTKVLWDTAQKSPRHATAVRRARSLPPVRA